MLMVLLLVLASIVVGIIGQLLLKVGANTPVLAFGDLAGILLKPTTVIALALYVGATLLWITVLSRAALSYAYPLLGLNYVFVVLMSAWILHEPVSLHRWIGVFVIAIGFLVAATS